MEGHMERRRFLATTSVLAASGLASAEPFNAANENGKDRRLKTITTDPLVLETPDELLAANRITPASALFVRNHHGAKAFESMAPRPLDGEIAVSGLVKEAKRIPLRSLEAMEKIEVEMVLQCTGNFRFLFSRASPIKGTPWSKGGVGNVRFRGVPVAAYLKASGIEPKPEAKYIAADGADDPVKPTDVNYEKSIPLDLALERGLLAVDMNGEPIPALHGGPVRLVLPGCYGSMHVKWLRSLRFDAAESDNFFQSSDYRTPTRPIKPGEPFKPTVENSVPAVDMRIASRILVPADGSTAKANEPITVKGVAWNDGAASITSVELSTDGGQTWISAALGIEAGKYAFREWSHSLTLPAGRHELWCRAVDAFGRTQPLDGTLLWNPGGYCWNGVEKISVTVR
jgi:sulfite oxidase